MHSSSDQQAKDRSIEVIDTITKCLARSGYEAVKQALIHGTPLVVWRDGKVEEIDPRTVPLPKEFWPGYYEGPSLPSDKRV